MRHTRSILVAALAVVPHEVAQELRTCSGHELPQSRTQFSRRHRPETKGGFAHNDTLVRYMMNAW
jgi:hypothetical protein